MTQPITREEALEVAEQSATEMMNSIREHNQVYYKEHPDRTPALTELDYLISEAQIIDVMMDLWSRHHEQ